MSKINGQLCLAVGVDKGRAKLFLSAPEQSKGNFVRHRFPYARQGQVVGLLGGSFDPAHEGHAHITREALKRFDLDRIWWLVSPGNPLKMQGPAPLEKRMARARDVMRHPRVEVTDIEAQLGTRYTAQTLEKLRVLYPQVRFVWLMGADNMAQLHQWQDWRSIMENVPIGVMARPGQRISARMSRAAALYAPYRLPARLSHLLARVGTPAWCFVNVPMTGASSTAIRATGAWSTQAG